MSRARPSRQAEQPGSAYELLWRLERSYRPYGWLLVFSGLVGFGIVFTIGDPWLVLLAGAALAGGIWLLRNDPREYLALQPRTRRLQLLRSYGRRRKVRREYDLREFSRLETAQYDSGPKGRRCMILLWRDDGTVEKVDDRIHDAELVRLCGELAEEAELDYLDKGRIDVSS